LDPILVSDDLSEHGQVHGFPIVGLEEVPSDCPVVVAIADGSARRRVVARVEQRQLAFSNLIAPTAAYVGPAVMDEGGIIGDFTVLSDVRIGRHFQINVSSYVGHDCVIGDFVTLAPRVSVIGNVVIEDDVYIGTGAIIRNGTTERPITIGRGAFIAMGALVSKDVAPGARVMPRWPRPTSSPHP
jgi:sugar O-acyltransferase (sialic acid O-acetyltransferase NeuD family)